MYSTPECNSSWKYECTSRFSVQVYMTILNARTRIHVCIEYTCKCVCLNWFFVQVCMSEYESNAWTHTHMCWTKCPSRIMPEYIIRASMFVWLDSRLSVYVRVTPPSLPNIWVKRGNSPWWHTQSSVSVVWPHPYNKTTTINSEWAKPGMFIPETFDKKMIEDETRKSLPGDVLVFRCWSFHGITSP